MASSRDVTNRMARKSSIDGASNDDLSVFVSFALVLFHIFLLGMLYPLAIIIKVRKIKKSNFPTVHTSEEEKIFQQVIPMTHNNKKYVQKEMFEKPDFLNCFKKILNVTTTAWTVDFEVMIFINRYFLAMNHHLFVSLNETVFINST